MSIEKAKRVIENTLHCVCKELSVIKLSEAMYITQELWNNDIFSFKLEVNDGEGVLIVDDLDICCEVVV